MPQLTPGLENLIKEIKKNQDTLKSNKEKLDDAMKDEKNISLLGAIMGVLKMLEKEITHRNSLLRNLENLVVVPRPTSGRIIPRHTEEKVEEAKKETDKLAGMTAFVLNQIKEMRGISNVEQGRMALNETNFTIGNTQFKINTPNKQQIRKQLNQKHPTPLQRTLTYKTTDGKKPDENAQKVIDHNKEHGHKLIKIIGASLGLDVVGLKYAKIPQGLLEIFTFGKNFTPEKHSAKLTSAFDDYYRDLDNMYLKLARNLRNSPEPEEASRKKSTISNPFDINSFTPGGMK